MGGCNAGDQADFKNRQFADHHSLYGDHVDAPVFALRVGGLSFKRLYAVASDSIKVTCMVFFILLGASMFSLVFRGLGGDVAIEHFLTGLPGGRLTAFLLVMSVMFLLGFFLDYIEIIFMIVPIVGPILIAMGFSPLWLGVMIGLNLQTSFLTPPFGFALFYLRGVISNPTNDFPQHFSSYNI